MGARIVKDGLIDCPHARENNEPSFNFTLSRCIERQCIMANAPHKFKVECKCFGRTGKEPCEVGQQYMKMWRNYYSKKGH